jgi:hypothetical protein
MYQPDEWKGFQPAAAGSKAPGWSGMPLFYYQVVFHGSHVLYGPGYFTCLVDFVDRVDKTAQLNHPVVGFDVDLQRFQCALVEDGSFYFGRYDRVIDVLAGALVFVGGGAAK